MKMQNYIHNFPHYLVIDIEKPMYIYSDTDCVRVNEKYIKRATQNCQLLVIQTPNGEKVFMPKGLKKAGKKVKEVFLYEDRPMTLFEIMIPHCLKSDEDKWRWS